MIVPINIKGYEHYSVSVDGVIYSTENTTRTKKLEQPVVRKPHPNKNNNYLQVMLQNSKDGLKPKLFYVHRLVAHHFIPNPNNHLQVNHLDYNKNNNTVENLEWVTIRENIQHSMVNRKLISRDILNDKELLERGIKSYKKHHNTKRVCRMWNCSPPVALKIFRLFDIPIKWNKTKSLQLV
jgi:hypothetical protein